MCQLGSVLEKSEDPAIHCPWIGPTLVKQHFFSPIDNLGVFDIRKGPCLRKDSFDFRPPAR